MESKNYRAMYENAVSMVQILMVGNYTFETRAKNKTFIFLKKGHLYNYILLFAHPLDAL